MGKIKVTREEIISIWNVLYKLKDLKTKALSFYTKRNMDLIEKEIEAITTLQQSAEQSEEYKKFIKDRINLCEKFCDKNDDGSSVIVENRYIFSTNPDKVEKQFKKLTDKYFDVISEHDQTVNNLVMLLKEEIEIEIVKIPFNLFPNDINYSEIELIVKETPDEISEILLNEDKIKNINLNDLTNAN